MALGRFSSNRFWGTFFVQKTSQKPSQNEARTLPKSMPKTCCFLTSIFSGLGLDFGASWASKSAALLAAPGVLDPIAFLLFRHTAFAFLGGAKVVQRRGCVGGMLALCWLTFRSWARLGRFFHVLLRFVAALGRFWCVLEAPGSIWEGSGGGRWMVFEASAARFHPHFSSSSKHDV